METLTIYAFVYSSCIYEEGPVTQSLHKTRRGAEMAMEFHKAEKFKEYPEHPHESWDVIEMNINN